jgi:CheY-like chemotaxis protein
MEVKKIICLVIYGLILNLKLRNNDFFNMIKAPLFTKVLLLEDNKMDMLLTKMVLNKANYCKEIISFEDPVEALSFFTSIDEQKDVVFPDLIILDINLPKMNGFQFLEKVKKFKNKKISDCKVYLLSSSDRIEEIDRSKIFNVSKFLVKPLDEDQLL